MITKEMTIGEVIQKHPEAIEKLFRFGMGCVGCPSSQMETIEDAAKVHGVELEKLMVELNS